MTGFTLVRDELLNFTIGGCDPDPLTAIPVAITVQGSALPAGAFAAKVDDAGESGTQIPGATVTGNTIRYTLTDNGSLDLDPDAGELRDPVAVGIILPVLPVPIPYWVLGLLTGLMGWVVYRRLRLA